MPLLDHFHPPLYPLRRWESIHAAWATALMTQLNQTTLPDRYFAETQVHIGGRVEVDLATLEGASRPAGPTNGPTTAVAEEVWAPPAPPLSMPAVFPDEFEVQVYGSSTGAHLVAAIELISPGNKDRVETRRAFAVKCASFLQLGVGLVIVDVVTERLANFHDELMRLTDQPEAFDFPPGSSLYAAAYRPVRRDSGDQIECWPSPLALGGPLPVLPLALRGGPTVPVDLEAAYMAARRASRL